MILKKYIRFEARSRSIYFNKVTIQNFFSDGGGGGKSERDWKGGGGGIFLIILQCGLNKFNFPEGVYPSYSFLDPHMI